MVKPRHAMSYTTLVSTDTLEANLASWVVLDCRFDLHDEQWGRSHYRAGHVPGAQYVSLNEDLAGARTGRNGRHPLPRVETLAATFGRLGVSSDAQVVVYDQDAGLFASRCWWSLRYLGHDAVALLDGGWARWLREGRAMRRGDETRPPAVFVPRPRLDMRVQVDDVAGRAGRPDAMLIDARGPDRFEGRNETLDPVAGHIPGARNIFYRTNFAADGTMLPADALRANYAEALGGRPPQDAVMYCGSGVSACVNLLAMEHAGLPGAKLYVGSWSEWSSDPARPIETGPARS
jgi:thiosulfate/3-mercaptopyruvate sulfurtransferase